MHNVPGRELRHLSGGRELRVRPVRCGDLLHGGRRHNLPALRPGHVQHRDWGQHDMRWMYRRNILDGIGYNQFHIVCRMHHRAILDWYWHERVGHVCFMPIWNLPDRVWWQQLSVVYSLFVWHILHWHWDEYINSL